MATIPQDGIVYAEMSRLDPLGRLFRWNGKIYRGIHPAAADRVRALFASGCLEALTQAGLFPPSRISDHTLEGFALVVEHEEIPAVVYPYEWSFNMLRDAALAALQAVEIAARYGWELIDLHPYNVLLRGDRPMYVDLGSFQPLQPGKPAADQHKFIKAFWRPLTVWASGDSYLAHSILFSAEPFMPDLSWWLYRHSGLRAFSPRFSLRWSRRIDRWMRNAARLLGRLRLLSRLPAAPASRLPVDLLVRDPALLRRKIARLRQPLPSPWDNYHTEVFRDGQPVSNPRFDRILEILRSLDTETAVELAGNQGAFTLLMATQTQLRKIVCTDYSSSAINRFYQHCKTVPGLGDKYLQGAVLNFMAPDTMDGIPAPWTRLQSDAVIALGVLHHLILTQRFHPRALHAALRPRRVHAPRHVDREKIEALAVLVLHRLVPLLLHRSLRPPDRGRPRPQSPPLRRPLEKRRRREHRRALFTRARHSSPSRVITRRVASVSLANALPASARNKSENYPSVAT
jgi:hypothetical protein